MLPGRKYTPEDILRILSRRWWMIALPLLVGLAGGVYVFRHIPELFRSETLIMVVPQRIPDDYVKSTVTAKIEDRLPSISDQILSRSRLERIVTDLDLYKTQRAAGALEDVIQQMRADIDVRIEGKESFRVSYVSRDPTSAQRVTERLASLYIEENLRDRENLAENTNQFLESQLEEARRRLVEHEKKLEEYRQRYSGQLPTQLQGNLQAIQNSQLALQSLDESTNRARERRLLVERQLGDARAVPVAIRQPDAGAAAAEGAVPPSTAQQLEAAQARLTLFKMRYTADHPDVKALERTIRDLEAKLQEEARSPQGAAPRLVPPAEAERLRRVKDLEAELVVIDHQVASNEAEAARLKRTIADYQAKVEAVPARESELVALTRDYGTLQQTYSSLLAKHEDAKLSANLERRQIGEQFKILDTASLPQRPYNRMTRLGAIAGGGLGGLACGLGFIVLLEYRDSSFKREDDVIRVLSLPVLALIPLMDSEADRRRRIRRRTILGVASAVLALASIAALWKLQS